MKYPKVGEKFYWKNQDGEIFEDTCLKIEADDIPTLETMFFTSLTENGGGSFITESDIIDSNSIEVKEYKKLLVEQKIKEIAKLVVQPEVHDALFKKLSKEHDHIEVINILHTLAGL